MNNKIKLSILSLSAVALLASCDLDAPTQSSLDEQSVFSTYEVAVNEVMSIHQSFAETNSYRGRFLPFYGINTDVEWINEPDKTKETDPKQSLANYNTLADNTQMNTTNNAYAKFYEGIERANLAIKNIREYGDVENNKRMAHLLGEALTLRAVIYNDLIKAWGDVPARFEPNTNENMYKPRCNRDSIYKTLLADLKEAEGYCYWPNENKEITSTTERVSKSFVKGLRARIALYAGGYSLRGDGYRLSKDPELAPDKMYQIAKEECTEIIAHGSNKLGSFKENFQKLCNDDVTAGGESLWEIPFSDGRGRVLYTWGVKHQAKDQYTSQPNGGVNGPTATLFYDYDKDDVRRNITCVPYEWSKDQVTAGVSYQSLRKIHSWCFGKLRYEWMKRTVTSTNDDGVNFQYMRLADVYLMAAEAINELDNDQATAWTYMEPVLSRVLPADKVSALKAKYTASQTAFQNGIVEQRGLEFAGEQLRKADLIRWGIIDEKMAEEKEKLARLQQRTGEYADLLPKLYYRIIPEGTTTATAGCEVFDDIKGGETIEIYGLNHGDVDEDYAKSLKDELNFDEKGWFESKGVYVLTNDCINGFYTVDKPSEHSLWPIWKTFIDSSNGQLTQDLLSD